MGTCLYLVLFVYATVSAVIARLVHMYGRSAFEANEYRGPFVPECWWTKRVKKQSIRPYEKCPDTVRFSRTMSGLLFFGPGFSDFFCVTGGPKVDILAARKSPPDLKFHCPN
eukprot:122348-Prymnesium_polylepis.2